MATSKNLSPEFLAACRLVLGDDSPAVVLGAMRDGDPRMNEVHTLLRRDPAQWFCSAVDETGTARLWAKGDSEQEARQRAELAVTKRRENQQEHRNVVPRGDWTFVTYPPDAA